MTRETPTPGDRISRSDRAAQVSQPIREAIIEEAQNNDWAEQRAQPTKLRIGPYSLVLTCSACPEQYDVFLGDEQVGYLRLRHGSFRADTPHCGGETVYRAEPVGDGIFETAERERYLIEAVEAIDAWRGRRGCGPSSDAGRQPEPRERV